MYSYLPGCLQSLNLTLSYFLEVIGGGGGVNQTFYISLTVVMQGIFFIF